MEITVEVSGYQLEQVARSYLNGAMPHDQQSVITEELSHCELESLYQELNGHFDKSSGENIAVEYLQSVPSEDQITVIKQGLTRNEMNELLRSVIPTLGTATALDIALLALNRAVDNNVDI